MSNISELPGVFSTDHTVLNFFIDFIKPVLKKAERTVYNYKAARWDLLKTNIIEDDLCSVVQSATDLNDAWSKWLRKVEHAMDQTIPRVKIKGNGTAPWFDSEIRHLHNVKMTAWRRAKSSMKQKDKCTFKKIRRKLKKTIKGKYSKFINNLSEEVSDNPKRFWSFFRSKTKVKSVPQLVSDGDSSSSDLHDKVGMFNKYFQSVFEDKSDELELPEMQNLVPNQPNLSTLHLTVNDVFKVISALKVGKACGPDNLSPRILKECATELAPSLTCIFNRSLASSSVPSQWKEANIIPVFKNGDRSKVSNYRPVSLLCVVSKVMERCIHQHVYSTVQTIINPLQHGFTRGRSCATQLVEVYDMVSKNLDSGIQTDMLFLDFSKAFDSVNHALLLHKLELLGFSGELLAWFKDYLNERRQRVVLDNCSSDWINVTSGVPQGSILGPLLFLLYINDMPACVRSSTVAMFADDAKCFKQVINRQDCDNLQIDIDNLYEWSVVWRLKFNPIKCKVMSFTRSANPINYIYTLNGTPLECVSSFKDLGVIIDNDLSQKSQISNIISKCNKVGGMIKRSLGYKAPTDVSIKLYKALVRSIAEYSSPVWSPQGRMQLQAVERIQRHFTKFALHYPDISYKERCTVLGILPLCYRREILDLKLLFKSMYVPTFCNGIADIIKYYNPDSRLRSCDNGIRLQTQKFKTENYKNYFTNRIVYFWNTLPSDVRSTDSLYTFNTQLNQFYNNTFSNVFDCSNLCTWTSMCRCHMCACTSIKRF